MADIEPSVGNDYQVGPTLTFSRDRWNAVMASLSSRLRAREALEASFHSLIAQGTQQALDVIQQNVGPQLAEITEQINALAGAIDDLVGGGTSPNALQLGGRNPSYYLALANATGLLPMEQVNGIGTALDAKAPLANPTFTGSVTAPSLALTNNGACDNLAIGNDVNIGDIDVADTVGLKGRFNPDRGFIQFGASGKGFGWDRDNLVFGGDRVWHAGNFTPSSYYNKTEISAQFGSYYTKTEINTWLGSYYSKLEINAQMAGKLSTSGGTLAGNLNITTASGSAETLLRASGRTDGAAFGQRPNGDAYIWNTAGQLTLDAAGWTHTPKGMNVNGSLKVFGGEFEVQSRNSEEGVYTFYHVPGVKRAGWHLAPTGALHYLDTNGTVHFSIDGTGHVSSQQLGDFGQRIEDRAYAWADLKRAEAVAAAFNFAEDRVYRIQLVGAGQADDQQRVYEHPVVICDAWWNTTTVVRRARTLQMYIASQGGWVNVWVS